MLNSFLTFLMAILFWQICPLGTLHWHQETFEISVSQTWNYYPHFLTSFFISISCIGTGVEGSRSVKGLIFHFFSGFCDYLYKFFYNSSDFLCVLEIKARHILKFCWFFFFLFLKQTGNNYCRCWQVLYLLLSSSPACHSGRWTNSQTHITVLSAKVRRYLYWPVGQVG